MSRLVSEDTTQLPVVRPASRAFHPSWEKHLLWPAILLLALCFLAGILLIRSHALIGIENDHQGMSLFGAAVPGQSLHATVVVRNTGLLPYTYTVRSDEVGAEGEVLEIRQAADGRLLYSGPPPRQPVSMGRLEPGQRARLDLTVSPAAGRAALPIATSFTWSARATLWPALVAAWLVLGLAWLVLLVAALRGAGAEVAEWSPPAGAGIYGARPRP